MHIATFKKTVTVAGTSEALATSAVGYQHGVAIRAPAANTGKVFIGALGVAALTGYELAAGETYTFPVDAQVDLSKIGLDAAVSGEGVCVIYHTA